MGCIYDTGFGLDTGRCSLCDPDFPTDSPSGSVGGFCDCIDDPDPSDICDFYESDYVCPTCGVDLNTTECTCE